MKGEKLKIAKKMSKTIVFDVDETILTTKNRDYGNSQPIYEIVDKMKILKENGWKIVLHTARGMGRSGGDIEKVYKKVEAEVVKSCKKHNIPYDELILGKTWATAYVDDKAMTPKDFVDNFENLLKGKQ